MKSPDEISLAKACEAFAVANTPLFLVRKLRDDPSIAEIARSFSGAEIIAALRDAVERDPAELVHAVRPYAYLVALSKQPHRADLRTAAAISAPKWGWFPYIASVLMKSFSPVLIQNIRTPHMPTFSVQSNIPAPRIILPGR